MARPPGDIKRPAPSAGRPPTRPAPSGGDQPLLRLLAGQARGLRILGALGVQEDGEGRRVEAGRADLQLIDALADLGQHQGRAQRLGQRRPLDHRCHGIAKELWPGIRHGALHTDSAWCRGGDQNGETTQGTGCRNTPNRSGDQQFCASGR